MKTNNQSLYLASSTFIINQDVISGKNKKFFRND